MWPGRFAIDSTLSRPLGGRNYLAMAPRGLVATLGRNKRSVNDLYMIRRHVSGLRRYSLHTGSQRSAVFQFDIPLNNEGHMMIGG